MCLILCFTLAFCSVFGASAASFDPGYNYSYDILSLSTADYDNHVVIGSSKAVTFELPYVINGNYVDIVISTTNGSITAASCGNATSQQDLNVLRISSRLVRVYGTITTRNFSEIVLNLTSDNSSTAADFLSFKLFKPSVNIHQTLGRLSAQVLSHPEQHYGQTSYGEVLSVDLDQDTGAEIDTASILLTCPDWQKYDYVEFMVYGKFSSFDALVARVDDVSVPFSVTPLDGSSDIFSSHSDNVWRNMIISVDVRDVVRSNSLAEDLRLRVDLNISFYAGFQALFYLRTVNGIIDSSNNVTQDFWWNKVLSSLSSGFSSVVSSVESGVSSVVSAIESGVSSLGVKLNNINSSLSGITAAISAGFSSVITELQNGFPSVVSAVESMSTAVQDKLTSVYNVLSSFAGAFSQWVNNKWTGFVTLWTNTLNTLHDDLNSWFDSLWSNISTRWNDFQSWLKETFDPDSSDIDEVGDQIGDDVDSIEKIEQDIFVDFDSNSHVITDALSIGSFASAFAFVGAILSGVWSGLGGYKVVFTLPIALAIVLYVCNRSSNFFRPHRSEPAVSKMNDNSNSSG